jgi:peptidoglycan/LPS O-acetylase OafA/YrhL
MPKLSTDTLFKLIRRIIRAKVNPVSPFPAVACIAIAISSAYLLFKRFGKPLTHDRYSSLDGLRGYLAFFVFLHHSSIWYFFLRSGQWKVPPSNIYTHFGQSSVALFFMITGFLFFSKLIDGRKKEIDWERLFVSRFLRLVPLYMFAMTIMFLMVIVVSKGVLNESIIQLVKGGIRWLGFTVLGNPDLNQVAQTWTMVAGVTWSLPYEWFFYFSLPLMALSVGVRAPLLYLALSIAVTTGLVLWDPAIHNLASFVGGIAAAFFIRSERFRQFAASKIATLIIIVCIVLTVLVFPTAYEQIPLLLLSVAFIFIACGNTLFGTLIHPVSRTIGEMAYSIYLLHGLMLFTTFHLLIGTDLAATYSPVEHWTIVASITPILIVGSFATYSFIESPAMQRTKVLTIWIRSSFASISRRRVLQR